MLRWTRFIVRRRRRVVVAWLVVFVLAGWAVSGLGDQLTNRFSVPGSEAERGLDLLKDRFGESGEGSFTLVGRSETGSADDPAFARDLRAAAIRAADAVEGGEAGPVQQAGGGVAYVPVRTALENDEAANYTEDMRAAIGTVRGGETFLSGFPAINHDTEKIYNEDLARGEAIAVPIAVIVLALMFGTIVGVAVPLLFAMMTIPTALGLVWVAAHYMDMAVYVTNIVSLIGLAIAIDYCMLVVFRFREELDRGQETQPALERTMATAGRATIFSGLTVALGLALLLFMPLPFMQSMGVGGLLVPLVSLAAAMTFLPAVLAMMGPRINRFRVVPKRVLAKRAHQEDGFWARLARSIMRRPIVYAAVAGALMLAIALPALGLEITSGDNRGVPKTVESTRGLALLEDTLGPGSLSPNQIVIDTRQAGGAWSEESLATQRRLIQSLRGDREVLPETIQAPALLVDGAGPPDARAERAAAEANLVDDAGQIAQIRAAGRSDSGTDAAVDLVARLRDDYVPAARTGGAQVLVTGAPAFGVDFVDKAYGAFPWLIVLVLILSYLLLMRAFRSLFLPLKAVIMNLLSVGATYGVLVLVFQHGWGTWLGFGTADAIEAWIPIFLFAMLFGLSMDYEVFMLSRMREEWDKRRDNAEAIAVGLERTGRIITAAAIIMIAAFSGFMFGSFVGLQQFGLGLAAAIFLDATVVRALLVPAVMKLMGNWNWYLPERLRRVLRLAPATTLKP